MLPYCYCTTPHLAILNIDPDSIQNYLSIGDFQNPEFISHELNGKVFYDNASDQFLLATPKTGK